MFLKNSVYLCILSIGCYILTVACEKAPHYSDIPAISFNSLKVVSYKADTVANPQLPPTDSVYITINFQDGNGDIGNSPLQGQDYFVNAYKKINGSFQIFSSDTSAAGTNFNGSLPLMQPYNLTGPIKGTVTENLGFQYLPQVVPAPLGLHRLDTLVFQIQIKDRANNYSNWIETSEMILWKDSTIFH